MLAAKPGTTVSFEYDHLGRRTSKTILGETTTTYKYDGWNVLREVVGTVTHEFTYDFTGRPLSKKSSGGTYYYIYNARGDVTAMVDSSGSIVNSYTYDVWGRVLSSSEGAYNPFRYASYRYDSETGLYYLRNRYYSPELMRFLTRDAVRDEVGKPETSNWYQYADENPVNKVDPDGKNALSYVEQGWFYISALGFSISGWEIIAIVGVSTIVWYGARYAVRKAKAYYNEKVGRELVREGKRILGNGHSKVRSERWKQWWSGLRKKEKKLYRKYGGPRPTNRTNN